MKEPPTVTSSSRAVSERPSASRAIASKTARLRIDLPRSDATLARSQLSPDESHGPGKLRPEAVEQLARRIADLISARLVDAVVDALIRGRDLPTARLVDAATIAERCGVERRFVYDHQRELGAIRLGRIGQTNHRLDALGFFKRHGTEGDDLRRQAERLESQRAYTEQQHTDTVRDIAAQRADNDPVAWIDRHAEQIRYLRALEDELSARDRQAERQLVVAAQIDPPDHITAVLGPRPDSYINLPAWERGVTAIETYRHRQGIAPDHAASALGQAPDRRHRNPDFGDAERAVCHARIQLGLGPDTPRPERPAPIERLSEPPQRDLSIGRDTGLSIDL